MLTLWLLSCLCAATLMTASADVGKQSDQKQPQAWVLANISAPHIPLLLEEDLSGPYGELFTAIFSDADFAYSLRTMPSMRAQQAFVSGDRDCIYLGIHQTGFYESAGLPTGSFLLSDPINNLSLKVYVARGKPVPDSLDALRDKRFAAEASAAQLVDDRISARPEGASILTVSNVGDAFRLLDNKRVDAVISFDLDATIYLGQTRRSALYETSASFSLYAEEDAIVCHNTAVGRQIIEHANDALRRLRDEGPLIRFFDQVVPE